MKIICFETLPSTNLYLKENYHTLENFTTVLAKRQTAGRGRMGREWVSSDDLMMSVLIKDNISLEKVESISLVICASIYKVLKKYLTDIKIKWPNDILVTKKKVCGILLESVVSTKLECLIIGLGININSKEFSSDLKNKATSLSIITGLDYDILKIASEILEEFRNDYINFLNGSDECFKICEENSCLINQEVSYIENDKEKVARVVKILRNGHILLENSHGVFEKSSGEVSLHINYNND